MDLYFFNFQLKQYLTFIQFLILVANKDLMSTSASSAPTVPPGSKPTSIKVEPWTEFPRQSFSIHSDDFCHSKSFVAKFTAKGSRSTLNIKQTVNKKDGKYSVEDDVKLWFDLPNNHSLYTRVKSTDYIKIHYDHGITQCNNQNWNLYGSFLTDKSLSKTSLRLGAATLHPKCNSDNRLRVNTVSGGHSFYWYNRTISFHNQSKFGVISVVDLSNRVLQKNNVLFGHVFNSKHQTFLRLENDTFRKANPNWTNIKSLWDTVTANYVGKLDQTTKVGLQVSLNLNDFKIKNAQAVVQKLLPENKVTVKAKVNKKYDVAFLFKRALWGFQDLATLSLGLGVNAALSDKRSIQHGVQLDFNI